MLLFASGNPHLPQVVGGLEINTHELALELNRRGEHAAVFSKLSRRDWLGLAKSLGTRLSRKDVTTDTRLGYQVFRSLRPWRDIRGLPKPRVVIVQNGNMIETARTFLRRGIPSVAYLHGTAFDTAADQWAIPASDLPFSAYIANSEFTAARFRARFNIQASVIPPVFRPERYRSKGERNCVSFVNPVPEKGVDLVLALAARCPQIPFRMVKAWPLTVRQHLSLRAQLQRLPNVRVLEPTNDMRTHYGSTRILLMPSQWDETWGRTASEAQISGIPVLASDSGGLPEAVGPGGVILPRNAPVDVWRDELLRLWNDNQYYARLSAAAMEYSQRPALNLDCQVDRLLTIVKGHVA